MESSIVESARTCPVCAGAMHRTVGSVHHYVDGRDDVRIVECARCAVSWADSPIPIDGLYDAIYRHAAELPGYARYARLADLVDRDVQRGTAQRLWDAESPYAAIHWATGKLADRSARVLEVGSGLGYTTAALRAEGLAATGLDASSEAVRRARDRFGDFYVAANVDEQLQTHRGQYDLVIATEVIEHVTDPVRFLSDLLALATPGSGAVLLTTPNKDRYGRYDIWATELPPVHVLWFGMVAFEALARAVDASLEWWPPCRSAATTGALPVLGAGLTPHRAVPLVSRIRHRLIGHPNALTIAATMRRRLVGDRGDAAAPAPTLAALFRPNCR